MSERLPETFVRNPSLHAYLYVSPDARDRQSTAWAMAKSILCRNRAPAPCLECDCCKKMQAASHPDCLVFSAGKKSHVKDVRELLEEAYLSTNEADFKVFILEDADEYNEASQNVLLKVVEEPPRGVRFILTASSASAILPTVRSRVCAISGTVRQIEDILQLVKEEKPSLSPEKAKQIAYFALGYEKADIKQLDEEKIFEYVNKAHLCLSGKDANALLSFPSPLSREELMLCLQVFMLCLGQLAFAKANGVLCEGVLDKEALSECISRTSTKKAHALYDLFEECYLLAEGYANINAVHSYLIQKAR